MRENEIKLAVEDLETARKLLRAAGFRVSKRRVFERNTVFDTPDAALRNGRALLRIREAGNRATVTYKGRPDVSKRKSREELELEISDPAAMGAVFERLGFRPLWRYEKFRTEYSRDEGAGVATLDETPVGLYLELEGPPRWIDSTAAAMGFTEKDYITASYGRLYLEWCERLGKKPANMAFPAKNARRENARRSGGQKLRAQRAN
jgi:adenylate cyclase class 2